MRELNYINDNTVVVVVNSQNLELCAFSKYIANLFWIITLSNINRRYLPNYVHMLFLLMRI